MPVPQPPEPWGPPPGPSAPGENYSGFRARLMRERSPLDELEKRVEASVARAAAWRSFRWGALGLCVLLLIVYYASRSPDLFRW